MQFAKRFLSRGFLGIYRVNCDYLCISSLLLFVGRIREA